MHDEQRLGGYRSLNPLNSNKDESARLELPRRATFSGYSPPKSLVA
jgi:hypothetical protein